MHGVLRAQRGIQFVGLFICGLLLVLYNGQQASATDLAPATRGLQCWVRSDDLTGYTEGQHVDIWPDAGGLGHHLKATGDARPTLHADGIAGHPTVQFTGSLSAKPMVNQYFDLPLSGEWGSLTIFAVGKQLDHAGWFDSAPSMAGCLRTMGWMQLTGTKLALDRPFPAVSSAPDAPAVATITIGTDAHGVMHLETAVNGKPQASASDDSPLYGVLFRNAHIGNNNGGENVFNGELAELLVYKGRLSEAERAATERYLLVKYALAEATADEKIVNPLAKQPEKTLPPVKSQPVKEGLQLWVRADDLKNLVEGQPVDRVPDAGGQGHDLTADGAGRPGYLPRALGGRPALRFDGKANPKVVHFLSLPITGEWSELTLLVAGRHLDRAGVFDSAPGYEGCLRTMGWLQLTGSKLGADRPFPLLQNDDNPQVITIMVRKNAKGGQTLTTYANGHQESESASENTMRTILFRDPHLGTNNTGETAFNGEIAEVLLYNRPLTDVERTQDIGYLAEKYGVPTKSDAQIARERKARSRWTLALPQLPRTMSWFGNSFSGKDNTVVQSGFNASTALPDGTMVAMSIWDEVHHEGGFYKDGKALQMNLAGKGAGAVTTDGQYIYAAHATDDYLTDSIRRYTLDGTPTPQGDWITFPKCAKQFQQVRGLAVGNGEVYVVPPETEEVRVYDAATAQFKRAFPLAGAGRLACDAGGKLWVGLAEGVVQYTPDGTPTGKRIPAVHAGALTVDAKGRLLVADDDRRQQVIVYDLAGVQPREVATLGERGGVFAAPRRGAMGDNRLLNLNGVGVDAAGNVYVSGGGMLRSYTSDGKLRWHLECTQFCTCADFDPATDGKDIYTGAHHYAAVAGQPAGKDWQWRGYTADALRFPEATSGGGQILLRRINGHLLRYTIGESLLVHRQEPGSEIFIPCGMYYQREYKGTWRPAAAPKAGRFYWCDGNGDGQIDALEMSQPPAQRPVSHESFNSYVDDNGGIWEPQDRWGVRYLPLKSISPDGVPVYDFTAEVWFKRPAEFIQVLRAVYLPATDTMYLAGNTWDHPSLGNESWGQCGREVIRYDDWSKLTRRVHCRMPFPDDAVNIHAIAIAASANRLFAGEMETSVLFTYDTQTGKLLGIIEPDADLVGGVGWIDIDSGIRAFTRKNGEVLLLVEDSYAEKQLVYRLPAPGGK